MPKIEILERNLTLPTNSVVTDIAFIPGFTAKGDAKTGRPILCSSLTEFETEFGKTVPKVDTTQDDKSYLMARELIKAGMPIYYYAFGDANRALPLVYDSITINGDISFYPNSFTVIDPSAIITVTLKSPLDATITASNITVTTSSEKYTASVTAIATDKKILTITLAEADDAEPSDSDEVTLQLFLNIEPDVGPTSTAANTELGTLFAGNSLKDKAEYDFKYLTAGAYGTSSLWNSMAALAEARGDCIALIDSDEPTGATGDVVEGVATDTFYKALADGANKLTSNQEYATAFYPWGKYKVDSTDYTFPGSFAYLRCLADALKTNPSWLAIAGVTRGVVPGYLEQVTYVNNAIADIYQPTSAGNLTYAINTVTNIRPYGYTVWGNRTLKPITEGLDALHFLHIRNMICDVKKIAYKAARKRLFEQNTDILWIDFKSEVETFLLRLKSGNGIASYRIYKTATKANGDPLSRGEVACVIQINPIDAVEGFYITVDISGNGTVEVEG